MILRRIIARLAGSLFGLTASGALGWSAEPNRLSEAGLAILDTPDAWHAFVSGPVTAFAYGADHVLFVGSNRLATYDGASWRSINVPGVYGIRALTPTNDGKRIWLGAVDLVGYIERNAQGEWNFVSLNAEFVRAGVREIGEIRYAFLQGEKVVFVERAKVYRWTPPALANSGDTKVGETNGRVEVWDLPGRLRMYPFMDGDSLLFYETGVGLWRMEAEGPKLRFAEKSLPSPPPMVGYITWPNGDEFAVFTEGVFRRDGEQWIRVDEVSEALRGRRAIRAIPMEGGLVAIGTFYGGLVLIRADGSVQDVLTVQSGLADLNIDKLWADDTGQLWIGLWTGFARLSGVGAASLYDQRLGFGTGSILKALRLDGNLTAITSQGVYTLTPSRNFEPATFTRQDTHFEQVRDGVEMDGQLWLGSADGLWRIANGRAIREHASGVGVFFVEKLRAMSHGLLLFENSRCRAWLHTDSGWVVRDLNASLDSTPASTLEDRDGRLWVSTLGGHVRCFAWDDAAKQLRSVAEFSPGNGLPAFVARPVLAQFDGRMFVFTENDVLRLDHAGKNFEAVREFNDFAVVAAERNADQSAYWVVRRKDLGAAGPRALMRVESTPANRDVLQFTPLVAPGLDQIGEALSVDLVPGGEKRDLWLGGARALLRLDPEKLRSETRVPAVALQRLRVNSTQFADITSRARTAFASTVSRLEFNFAVGVAAITPGTYFYQTKLEGIETNWSPPETSARREFTGLAPGDYVFEVRAVDRIGQTGVPVRFAFRIEAPWYRRPSALAAWVAMAGLLVIGGVKWRVRQLKRHAEKLNELVNVRTRELSLSNAAKSEFLENISHEIRNPLNGITGLINLLDESGLSERQREHARALKECSQDLARVFHEVLNFSKLEYGYVLLEERAFSLRALIESVRALFHAAAIENGSTITVRFPQDFADNFRGDDAKLKTIVNNFTANALKYAPGTPVEISVSCIDTGGGVADVLIEVTDHGRGVPAEEQELIFKKFVRGRNARDSEVPGSGIGLATCRATARLMGGSVGIESAPGRGATFFVKLPLRRESAVQAEAAPADAPAGEPLHAALIVEDQHYNQIVLAGMLGKLGFRATCVRDGEEALVAIAQKSFDVVFLDIELPRVKGPEIARRIRAMPGGTRPLLVAVSAHDSREAKERCLAAGMEAFLIKPISTDSILSGLAEARMRRQSNGETDRFVPDFTALELYAHNAPGGLAGAIETYAKILRAEISALEETLATKRSSEEVARAAHRVRSHAQIVGASGVIAAAAKLEADARAGNVAQAAAQLAQIQCAAEEIEQALSAKV